MADIKSAIHTRLAAFSNLTALVSTRIYRFPLPQDVVLPCVSYRRISGIREHALSTESSRGTAHPVFEVTAWADDDAEAEAVAEQVRLALEEYSGTVTDGASPATTYAVIQGIRHIDQTDGYDDETGIFAVIHEFEIWHEETAP